MKHVGQSLPDILVKRTAAIRELASSSLLALIGREYT